MPMVKVTLKKQANEIVNEKDQVEETKQIDRLTD